MKIYLAGPDVFLPNAHARGAELKALCIAHGAVGLFPLDNELTDHVAGSISHAHAIRAANMELIGRSDAILANMTPFRGPSMDVGTAYEMGAGAALGKVVVGYTLDGGKSYPEKVKKWAGDDALERGKDGMLREDKGAGMFVEEFCDDDVGLVDNLMMSCGIEKLCFSEEDAIKAIVEVLRGRKADNVAGTGGESVKRGGSGA
ncbi:Uncharacterized protein BP5553_02306 [Venustampulla echinocandica]|uniref:Nucleoside 2-deoxyribosyltransferase n=1 Tax=Venustampulla echinocandica TaxID=2656787 RepID=A0A370U3G6_9HELO|nr:Uncharacterized protein BP5553_02306 [Venustampulla echinocandica]RDL42327.1 Uncharacterized protein BP5553_02306 [Venustampulla echinocandica]